MNNLSIKKMNEITKKKKKGFTLVELVIVIAIIAILAAMAIPKLGSMRTTAKVSNDVAAAKNIATVASTMVANGTLTASITDLSSTTDTTAAALLAQLDGKAKNGKAEAAGTGFAVTLASNGGITVSATGTGASKTSHELYPDNTGSGRTDYANDLS
jgi:type IV pilus assembly protein PilA